ncbi:MAG: ATP-binding protein [Coriobacteriales bacterium]|jgi:predicted AAA+ superfamily ATPase|nr:ATP-binding protein [Coriobacteriales bacterium]
MPVLQEEAMIARPKYLEYLNRFAGKKIIKVLTGARRSGKSTILSQFAQSLRAEGVAAQCIQFINFEDLENERLLEYHALHDHVVNHLVSDKMNFIFLDEVQRVADFEKAVDSLYIRDNVDVYLTGSNAHMLSGELATLLSGRYVEVEVYPLSFKEYARYQQSTFGLSLETAFDRYLRYGGFPYATQIAEERSLRMYVEGVVDTVLVKDVMLRRQRSDAELITRIATFLADSSGSYVTIKKIADTLTSQGRKTTSDTVSGYVDALQQAFLFYRAQRYDVAGKRHLESNAKYYPVDPGIRFALLGNRRPNRGHLLEAIVYMELRRRGYDVSVGNLASREVDFVAQAEGKTVYLQVTTSLADEQVYEREVSIFKKIPDNYPKLILSEDKGLYDDQGITQMNIIDWLLD